MKLRVQPLIIYIFSILIFAFPFMANAISPDAISVDIVPLNPNPGENTIINLSSYATNLDGVSISWFVNGKKISSAIGMKSFSLNAPSVGSETTVRAVVSIPDGDIEKKVVIRPSVMSILWQATDSYVPPFYRGKALPISESNIKVVALPEVKSGNTLVSTSNMLYDWKKNYTNDASASGYGKNSYTFVNDYLENLDNVSVTASTLDGKYSSQANVNISVFSPQISFYKNDSLLGILWDNALQDGHKIQEGDGETLVAEPYFISPKEIRSPSLVWNWFINGSLTNNVFDSRKNWMPIKVEGGVSGVSTVGVSLENKNQLLGTASKQISIEY